MIFNDMRIFLVIFLLQSFVMLGYAQVTNPVTIEEKAVKYFCDQVLITETLINQFKIQFDGATNGIPSKVYDVANCLGHINLIKDSIPNKIYLDSLEQEFSQRERTVIRINAGCGQLSKRFLFKRSGYRLYLYNAIEYNGIYCVEFFLANRGNSTYTIIVTLDKNLVPLSYCIKAIKYEV